MYPSRLPNLIYSWRTPSLKDFTLSRVQENVKSFCEQALIYWKFSRLVLLTSGVCRWKSLCRLYRITIARKNLRTLRRTFTSAILPTENLTCNVWLFEDCEYVVHCVMYKDLSRRSQRTQRPSTDKTNHLTLYVQKEHTSTPSGQQAILALKAVCLYILHSL